MANGFKLYVSENGGKLAGRTVQYVELDDESDPSKANENANKLVKRDRVDVLVCTSGPMPRAPSRSMRPANPP